MAIKLHTGEFACAFCGSKHPNSIQADACKESHQLLYIPMSKSELNRLIHALMNEDFNQVPAHLWETLQRYARYQVTDG